MVIARLRRRSLRSERMRRDELDPAAVGPAAGQFGERARPAAFELAGGLGGGASVGGAVAVVGVVELLEGERALLEVGGRVEALLPEEAFVEGVVEVLDGAVPPRLARRYEAGVTP
jgi:hypothetical protein